MAKVLSIAVPSYNVEAYLPDTLASYVAGGVDDRLEVLIVNDGSTDGTQRLGEEFVKLYPQVFRLVNKENGGHGSSINAGLAAATGKYFRIIDGDDRICTVNIPALLDALECADEDLIVDVKREVTIGTGESRLLTLPDDIPCGITVAFDEVCTRADLDEFFMIHSISMRTDFLRAFNISLLEHTFYVDYELIVKIASFAQTVRFVNLEVCNYYVGNAAQSVAPANYVKRWNDHCRVTEELLRFSVSQDLSEARQAFVDERVRLICNTHYVIALIYDTDRARGLERGQNFRAYLQDCFPAFARATTKRYYEALALHKLGFDAARLDKFMGR